MCAFATHLSATGRRWLHCWLVTVCVLAAVPARAIDVFSTQFEFSQGYSTNLDLAGQNGWENFGSGGNGIVANIFPGQGQQAYIGFDPPAASDTNLFVWKPLNMSPIAEGLPVVRFTTLLSIEDSSNGRFDYFQWQFLNNQTEQLLIIDFDVFATNVSYFLNGNDYVNTGVRFGLGSINTLTVTMNFASNRWSATLNSDLLATNQPITTTGKELTLGDVDAVWELYEKGAPGNNFMVFDNYTITAEALAPPPPHLHLIERTSSGRTLLRLTGRTGAAFAIDASTNLVNWTALGTNRAYHGSFDFIDSNSAALGRRLYRARWVPDLPD